MKYQTIVPHKLYIPAMLPSREMAPVALPPAQAAQAVQSLVAVAAAHRHGAASLLEY